VIALARSELLKLRSTRTALVLFIVVLVVVIVPLALLLAFVPRTWLEQDGVTGFLNTASTLVPLALLVFGILGMTGEYRHGTITYSYLVTPRRWQVMVMKLAVYAAVGMVLMLLAVGLVYATIGVGGLIRGVEIDASGGATAGDYARQIVVAGLITAFGVALGALVRLQAVTVAVTLIWALIAEPLVAALKPTVGNWLPFQVFNQVTVSNVSQQGAETLATVPGLDRPQAFLVSVGYIAVVAVAAVFISLRRDVT
jgi:ABC-type transport system involved in multi-copper enzyme maturation permease subunit